MSVNQVLRKNNINPMSVAQALQGARELVEKRGRMGAARLIEELTGIRPAIPTHNKKAVHFTQAIIQGLMLDNKADCNVLIDTANIRVEKMANDPSNAWMYVEKEDDTSTKVQVSSEVNVSVKVNSDGQIKKGGRAILAEELYNKYVINGTEAVTRSFMIDVFVREIGMTPAGASTYFANMKAKMGDPKSLITSKRKAK